MKHVIAYYRVSTARQGQSGLGLEAQQEAIKQYVAMYGKTLLKEFLEVKSGRKAKRPMLDEAMRYCKKNKAVLLIAKLDRLSRSVAFISTLMESKVEFVAVDFPQATPLVLHMLAVFAQHEAEQISMRTKTALQAAKRRGVRLGLNGEKLAERNKKESIDFSNQLYPVIEGIRMKGFTTIEAITTQLNKSKIPTYRPGCSWHKSTVHALLKTQQKSTSLQSLVKENEQLAFS